MDPKFEEYGRIVPGVPTEALMAVIKKFDGGLKIENMNSVNYISILHFSFSILNSFCQFFI